MSAAQSARSDAGRLRTPQARGRRGHAGALAAFYVLELAVNRTPPRGWAWPLLGLPGLLYLVSAHLERERSP